MKKILLVCICMLASLSMIGCASDDYDTYALSDSNEIASAIEGTIVASRPVRSQSKPGIATLGTAAIGGLAGSQIGGDGQAHAIGAIAGALLAGGTAAAVEKNMAGEKMFEYIIRKKDGNLITMTQNVDGEILPPGTKVVIVLGKNVRVTKIDY